MRHLSLPIITAAALDLLLCQVCLSGILPSFWVNECAWGASDIVVATEGQALDGRLTVLDVWKGSTQKGDVLSIPCLAGYAPKVSTPFRGDGQAPIKAVTGNRMVLFLIRGNKVREPSSQQATSTTQPGILWSGAADVGGMTVSMVWVEEGQVYSYLQVVNPGPSLLLARHQTEEQFRKEVEAVLAAQTELRNALSIKDPSERARTLKPMAIGHYWDQRVAAFDGLAACGKEGLPVLREMLSDDSYDQNYVVGAMVKAGGKDICAEIAAALKLETEYWRKLAPSLQDGWWNGHGITEGKMGLYRNRYARLSTCLNTLRAFEYPEGAETIKAAQEVIDSLPPMGLQKRPSTSRPTEHIP